jgi:hypothetical protein
VTDGATCRKNERSIQWNQQGPAGAPGISAAYEKFVSRHITDASMTMETLNLPAGNYVVQSKAHAMNLSSTASASVQCVLNANGTIVDASVATLGPLSFSGPWTSQQTISNLVTVQFTEDGTVALVCQDNGQSRDVNVQDAHLVATAVGSVTSSPEYP